MIRHVTAAEAKRIVHSGAEMAFLDVREAGQFGEGHPLFAAPCPYSRLEPLALRLAPNVAVPVVLIDAGDGVAERAAAKLAGIGYTDVSIIGGGAPGWEAAGFTLFKGVYVPSKTLGELAEHEWRPRTVQPETLREWQAAGQARLFDGRPAPEYRKMHVPGAICMPNGELAHRLDALGLDRGDRIVVGCAGRTRGIVGAIGLMLMGGIDEVYALENGTQGWALAGLELERGVPAAGLPEMSSEDREAARQRAMKFMSQWEIPTATTADVGIMLGDARRTTFVFDVRSEAEAEAVPLACARHVLGGQLVQATDQHMGVRHARIVLCDDTGVRAGLAAFWLRQLGFEPYVATIDDELRALPGPAVRSWEPLAISEVSAVEALDALRIGPCRLLDLRSSTDYRRGHLPEAVWATRARLPDRLPQLSGRLLLIADDEDELACAAGELRDLGVADAVAVTGGHLAMIAAGAEEVATPEEPRDDEAIDFLRFVHDRHDGNLEAARKYLQWETGLVGQLDAKERGEFRLPSSTRRADVSAG